MQKIYTLDTINELRYRKILLMMDADVDGSHIKGLFVNMIAYYWPSLLEIKGFINIFITPVVKATFKGKTKSFYKLDSYNKSNVKIKIFGLSAFRKPEVFVRAGDRASTGGLIGYLPYGGKIVISVPKLAEILVKPGERVTSFQTLLAKYKG